jgi:hypothetical protein
VRITRVRDLAAGTVQITLDLPVQTDPDRAADAAWEAVSRELAAAQDAQTEHDRLPEGLRQKITE